MKKRYLLVLTVFLLGAITFSVIQLTKASPTNPGHPTSDIGGTDIADRTFQDADYSFPGDVGIGTTTPTAGYKLDVAGFVNSNQTVDQASYPTIKAVQTASTLQDGSASTGTIEAYDNTWEAIKFTADGTHNIRSFGVRIKVSAPLTNAGQLLYGFLYSNVAGSPGTLISGSSYIRYGSLTTSFVEYQFSVSTTLVSGTSYWLVLKQGAAPTGGTISIDTSATGTELYSNSADGTTWNLESTKTGWFKIYGRTYYGVQGLSTNQIGVFGNSTNQIGVYGSSTSNYGVQGLSTNNIGIYGASTNSPGVRGDSTNGIGSQGVSTSSYGVQGVSTSNVGVYGTSTNGYGVQGVSTNSFGIYGHSTNSYGGIFYQGGTLTTANSTNTMLIRRYGVTNSVGSLNYSGNVLQITDNPTGTGTVTGALISGNIDGTTRLNFDPRVADGASAVAYMLDTKNTLTNATSKLFELRNGGTAASTILGNGNVGIGTTSPDEKFEVEWVADGTDVEIGRGTTDTDVTFLTLRSSSGTKYYIVVSDTGALSATTTKP